MELRFEEKNFQIPDSCPIDAPRNRILKRHLREHGIQSLLSSTKLAQFSGCVLDELLEAGAKIVESSIEASKQVPSSESVDHHEDKQQELSEPGSTQGSLATSEVSQIIT